MPTGIRKVPVTGACVICGGPFTSYGTAPRKYCDAHRKQRNVEVNRQSYIRWIAKPENLERQRTAQRERQRRKRKTDPDYELWVRHRMEPGQFDAMVQAQGGGCAICGGTTPNRKRPLLVDHDHTTGAVRGLLCDRCNVALGCMRDDPNRLVAAAAYILAHENGGPSMSRPSLVSKVG